MKGYPIVHVTFLDHAQVSGDDMKPAKIDLFGVLVDEDKNCLYIASWVCDNGLDHNTDAYAVVKHKGIKIKRLK